MSLKECTGSFLNAFVRVGLRLFIPWWLGLGLLSASGCDGSRAIQTRLRRTIEELGRQAVAQWRRRRVP